MAEIIYKEESYKIIGAIYEVYNTLGTGFLESVYQEALEYELSQRGIPFMSHPELKIKYHDIVLSHKFIPDIVCYDKIIVELKSVSEICDSHLAQLINYLKASGMKLGLLVNFGAVPKVDIRRFAL
ncbi:MAG: GxxExxY protein [Bacteroidales bacterium]|nr:GxxExxY protein [Bacteroidales bacterium]